VISYGDEDNTRTGNSGIVEVVDQKSMSADNRRSKDCDWLWTPCRCFRV
jgi:hypothetical protein